MALKPWYKVEGLVPREDLREGKGLDTAEFAVHLDQVRDERAPHDYQNPQRFFDRTYLTTTLTAFAAQVAHRLSGETTETSAIFNLATQFGGGKTHALTLLYHLAKNGADANDWTGVNKIIKAAGISTIPDAETAVFVGTEFDSLRGRGGDDGTPLRKTPWGEIAYQLGGEASFNVVAEHDREFIEPKGDVIRAMLPKDRPCLILMDEIINYVSTYRQRGYGDRLYNFVQALSETARGQKNVVLVVSIPASELEYTSQDETDEQRFKKMLDRLGKAVIMSAESETSEIIRRRLFEWDSKAVGADGRILLTRDAITTCNAYADWVIDHRQQLPSWFPIDNAREVFQATYPFHPTLLSVFERKWQALPRFQRTRGVLRMLALWVSNAYKQGYQGAHRDPLITLGTAPLDNPDFRSAVFEQMGDSRLEGAVTTDICGKKDAHAIRLDAEAVDAIKKSRLHRKAATTIFFESNGGCTRIEATLPEIRLDVAEPDLDIGNVETVLEGMAEQCYYLSIDKNKYRFSLSPNLNKILADRRASVQPIRINDRVRAEIQKVFPQLQGVSVVPFPEKASDITNRPVLTLGVLAPEHPRQDASTLRLIESLIREAGTSDRTFKSAVMLAIADSDAQLREETRKVLAWEDIQDEEAEHLGLDAAQKQQLAGNLKKAQRDVQEAVWRTYRFVALLGKDNTVRMVDLGLVTSSVASSMTKLIIDHLRQGDEIQDSIGPRFLVKNWSPAFQEWSTKAVRDAIFASPQFPRLLNPEAVKDTIVQGVLRGEIAYVGKAEDRYVPFYFNGNKSLSVTDVEISDDAFIITAAVAQAYVKRITDPPKLASLTISPPQSRLEPGMKQAFVVKGLDQYGKDIAVQTIQWSATGGAIEQDGVLTAGADAGNFTVTAKLGDVNALTTFTVFIKAAHEDEGDYDTGNGKESDPDQELQTSKGIAWRGEIPAQKWMNFYTRVLSKFASDKDLKLTLNVEISADGAVSDQKLEEARIALQELGLDDNVAQK